MKGVSSVELGCEPTRFPSSHPHPTLLAPVQLTADSRPLASGEVCCVAGAPPREAKVTQRQCEPWLHSTAPDRTLNPPAMPGV